MSYERPHQIEKPYKYDGQFTMKKYLRQHQIIHIGEKCFRCDECGKEFSQSSHLNLHKLIHTGEKAF